MIPYERHAPRHEKPKPPGIVPNRNRLSLAKPEMGCRDLRPRMQARHSHRCSHPRLHSSCCQSSASLSDTADLLRLWWTTWHLLGLLKTLLDIKKGLSGPSCVLQPGLSMLPELFFRTRYPINQSQSHSKPQTAWFHNVSPIAEINFAPDFHTEDMSPHCDCLDSNELHVTASPQSTGQGSHLL